MKPTEVLKKEHESILEMLQVMRAIAAKGKSGIALNSEHIEQVIVFLRVFADQCHHGKEETLLFPEMVNAGIPRDGGPIGVMEQEHVIGRQCIQGLAEGTAKLKAGDASGTAQIVENIQLYTDLLEQHIFKENNILFMMADMHLSPETQDTLSVAFDKVEAEVIGHDKHAALLQSLANLKSIYLV